MDKNPSGIQVTGPVKSHGWTESEPSDRTKEPQIGQGDSSMPREPPARMRILLDLLCTHLTAWRPVVNRDAKTAASPAIWATINNKCLVRSPFFTQLNHQFVLLHQAHIHILTSTSTHTHTHSRTQWLSRLQLQLELERHTHSNRKRDTHTYNSSHTSCSIFFIKENSIRCNSVSAIELERWLHIRNTVEGRVVRLYVTR